MNTLKNLWIILCLGLILPAYGQTKTNLETYKVLAKLISFDGGDKIHLATFKVLKNISENLVLPSTITVGYYNYKQPDANIDYVLLTLNKYEGNTAMKSYFVCPDYDGKVGIQKADIEFIDSNYWEGCETGKGDCKPLTFTRTPIERNWFLIMPCGGTETAVNISGPNFSKKLHLFHGGCPPHLDMSALKDGKYSASMTSCGLGGTVTFNLVTQ